MEHDGGSEKLVQSEMTDAVKLKMSKMADANKLVKGEMTDAVKLKLNTMTVRTSGEQRDHGPSKIEVEHDGGSEQIGEQRDDGRSVIEVEHDGGSEQMVKSEMTDAVKLKLSTLQDPNYW